MLQSNGYPQNFIESCIRKFNLNFDHPVGGATENAEKKNAFIYLPFIGEASAKTKRQLNRIIQRVSPSSKLICVFRTQKISKTLSKLKSKTPTLSRSNVVYKIGCKNCNEFYIGSTIRQLAVRVHEHGTQESSALYRHSQATKHNIDYANVSVLAVDNRPYTLHIKESLLILEQKAFLSLNRSMTATQLYIWP